jgi:hypothetical protein
MTQTSGQQFQLMIQKFVKSYHTMDSALLAFGKYYPNVAITQHVLRPDGVINEFVYMFDLKQGFVPKNEVEREANSLILDGGGNLVCLGLPHMQRFDGPVPPRIRWDDAWVEPFYRGTPFTIFVRRGRPFVAVRGCTDLAGSLKEENVRLYNTIRECLQIGIPGTGDPFSIFKSDDYKEDYTWHFIYTDGCEHPLHKFYSEQVVFLGAWNKSFNAEVRRSLVGKFADKFGLLTPACYVAQSEREVRNVCIRRLSRKDKGVVVVDNLNRRAVMYCAAEKTIFDKVLNLGVNVEPIHIVNLTKHPEIDSFVLEYPEYKEVVGVVNSVIRKVLEEIDDFWVSFSSIHKYRAQFAKSAIHTEWPRALFALWSGKARTPREVIQFVDSGRLLWEVLSTKAADLMVAIRDLREQLKDKEEVNVDEISSSQGVS